MKSLQEFKEEPTIVEEEKSDYTKFDMLVRAGLANKAQLARIHRILDKMQEERPVFNNADRMILQNLFNKMVDVISNNKQIFQQTRRVVREDTEELDERMLDTSNFKIGPSGRKVRAHRVKVGDDVYGKDKIEKEEVEVDALELTEQMMRKDPPFVLVLKRKALRLYPNGMKIALYFNDKLNKYFSVPYSTERDIDTPIQSEQVEITEDNVVMEQINHIVKNKQSEKVIFANGKSALVDSFTASAIKQIHEAVNDENKMMIERMIHDSPEQFNKVVSFAISKIK